MTCCLLALALLAVVATAMPRADRQAVLTSRPNDVDWDGGLLADGTVVVLGLDVAADGQIVNEGAWPSQSLASKMSRMRNELWVGFQAESGGRLLDATSSVESRAALVANFSRLSAQMESRGRGVAGVYFHMGFGVAHTNQALLSGFDSLAQALVAETGAKIGFSVFPSAQSAIPEKAAVAADMMVVIAHDNFCQFPRDSRPPCKHATLEFADRALKITRSHMAAIASKHKTPASAAFPHHLLLAIPMHAAHESTFVPKPYKLIASAAAAEVEGGADSVQEYWFNNVELVRQKVDFAVFNKMRGVALMDVADDLPPTHTLSLARAAKRKQAEMLHARDEEL